MILLVVMVIFYLLDEDLKIHDNYDIIDYTDLNTNIEKFNNDELLLYLYMMIIIEDQEIINIFCMFTKDVHKNGQSIIIWNKLNDKFNEPNIMYIP